jgi:hypothetical protein
MRSCRDSNPSRTTAPLALLPLTPFFANSRPFLPGTQGADAFLILLLLVVLVLLVVVLGVGAGAPLLVSQGAIGCGL